MKDFDIVRAEAREGQDRSFKLAGQQLSFRAYVHPEPIIRLQTCLNDAEFMAQVDGVFTNTILEPGQEKKWAVVRSEDNPLAPSAGDLADVINYALGVLAGRPTEPSSDSSSSSVGNGTSSTGRSRSKASTSAD